MRDESDHVGPDVTSSAYIATLTHFYRGEVGRMMVWRQRFDATTNWAIIATGSLVAFAVGNPAMIIETMLISLCLLGFFAYIESRRFLFYYAIRARVRMLEVHLIAPALLGHNRRWLEGPWREQLVEDLMNPSFKCSFAFALGRRFKHIYGALHLFLLLGWGTLVALRTRTFQGWVDAFGLGVIPGYVIVTLVLVYIIGLTVVIVGSGALRTESGEMGRLRSDFVWTSRPAETE